MSEMRTQAILACLGLPVRAPPTLPARPDDDLEATVEAWNYEPTPTPEGVPGPASNVTAIAAQDRGKRPRMGAPRGTSVSARRASRRKRLPA